MKERTSCQELEFLETQEWLDSLDYVIANSGAERAAQLLEALHSHARRSGARLPFGLNTPYVNTIPPERQPLYPGDHEIERRIRNIIRWNAMIMVVRANQADPTMGGHIATFASAATLMEVAFNHFLRGPVEGFDGDQVFFQAHTAPGIYARAFLEGRLSAKQLDNYRHELRPGGGLSSYPHPRLMPDFWQFPSASMGLCPIQALYQARFNRYLVDRGLKEPSDARVWAFMGDGEMDEPESLGAISLATREKLDNLIFVVNCNLQRLDGPVRGSGKIIQELETAFLGHGWNVLKVIWGTDWDPLLARDSEGLLAERMGDLVDGQYQKYSVSPGKYQRNHFFGVDDRLEELSRGLTDEHIRTIRRGGHDPNKVYAAYREAWGFRGAPSVVLAKTIKGYGMGAAGEGRMTAHQQKKLDMDDLREIRTRFNIPLTDAEVEELKLYRPSDDSREIKYLLERRRGLGGFIPQRVVKSESLAPARGTFDEFHRGNGRQASSTMLFVRILTKLLRDAELGSRMVPIVPDEARTFGMESLFRQYGIYSHVGQLYDPVDSETLTYYRESSDGQLIEEGITEAGAMSTFIAAGSEYATSSRRMLPVFVFYSIFGFQRVGDLIWAAGDQRARGFLIGATSGRTTLNGEGLQHQDGHSHLLAYSQPHVVAYDPAFGYEIAVIMEEGVKRMVTADDDVIYYLTVQNEAYVMPDMPDGAREGILRGMYRLRQSAVEAGGRKAHLFGSGSILQVVMEAATVLTEEYDVSVDLWSITSYQQLHRDGLAADRWNLRQAGNGGRRAPWVSQCLAREAGTFVLASDYMKALPNSIAPWFPRLPVTLGTDGFGRSESREALREFFEIDSASIVFAALVDLHAQGVLSPKELDAARLDLRIDPHKGDPADA